MLKVCLNTFSFHGPIHSLALIPETQLLQTLRFRCMLLLIELGHFMEFYQTVYNLKVNERKILIMGSSLQGSKMPCSSVINESLRSSLGALHLLKLPCKTNRSLWQNDFPISISCDDVLLFNAISKGIVWIAQGSWSNFHKLFPSLYNNQYFNLEQR